MVTARPSPSPLLFFALHIRPLSSVMNTAAAHRHCHRAVRYLRRHLDCHWARTGRRMRSGAGGGCGAGGYLLGRYQTGGFRLRGRSTGIYGYLGRSCGKTGTRGLAFGVGFGVDSSCDAHYKSVRSSAHNTRRVELSSFLPLLFIFLLIGFY